MPGCPTIGIHDNFPSGKAAIPNRAAYNKTSCRIDMDLGILVHPFFRQYRLDDVLHHRLFKLIILNIRIVLS